ncbi:RING finger protein 212B-like [Frankliniella occidentalis]|uniref:RING finger protein 212B-like n=1 Tax=Frankliniella occidentalis TaxID=133901 RepID=A0A6J1SDZ8_FRAOC|nr:RING finger protein 212B-like [Frankliniella occidentalis]
MDWIHCNGCFIQPRTNSNPPKFLLTSCGHIFCERCSQTETTNKCRVCEAQCTTTLLSNQLREEVRDYFGDPESLLSKVVKVVQYQKSHRERLLGYLRRLIPKYDSAKREIQKLHDENKTLRKKVHVQQQEIAWYKLQRDRLRASRPPISTPGSLAPSSPFPGMPSSDPHRGGLQHMRNSGLGNSRISMGFTSTPRQDVPSPLSVSSMPANTPFNPGQYRSQHFNTPESTPGGSSFVPPESPTDSIYRSSSQQARRQHQQHSPPSRGTPTDALKILSLAYKNANK